MEIGRVCPSLEERDAVRASSWVSHADKDPKGASICERFLVGRFGRRALSS